MGYRLALKAQLDTYIFLDFFLAVFLVIVAGLHAADGDPLALDIAHLHRQHGVRVEGVLLIRDIIT